METNYWALLDIVMTHSCGEYHELDLIQRTSRNLWGQQSKCVRKLNNKK